MWPPELWLVDRQSYVLVAGSQFLGCQDRPAHPLSTTRELKAETRTSTHQEKISMKKEGRSPHLKEKDFLCEVFRNTTVLIMSGNPGGIVTTLLHANWIECKWRRWQWTKIETHQSALTPTGRGTSEKVLVKVRSVVHCPTSGIMSYYCSFFTLLIPIWRVIPYFQIKKIILNEKPHWPES